MKKTLLTLSACVVLTTPAMAGGMGGCSSVNTAVRASKIADAVEPVAQATPEAAEVWVAEALPAVPDFSLKKAR